MKSMLVDNKRGVTFVSHEVLIVSVNIISIMTTKGENVNKCC